VPPQRLRHAQGSLLNCVNPPSASPLVPDRSAQLSSVLGSGGVNLSASEIGPMALASAHMPSRWTFLKTAAR
jgi:hypothetical protein